MKAQLLSPTVWFLGSALVILCCCSSPRHLLFAEAQSDGALSQYSTDNALARSDTSLESAKKILIDVYSATGGSQWSNGNNLHNWDATRNTNVCDWKGIYCYDGSSYPSRKGEIQQVDLSHSKLNGRLPGKLFSLPYLESLNLEGNSDLVVDLKLSSGLKDAQFLRFLTLSQTQVIGLEDISNARSLEVLRIADIKLGGPIPTALLDLPNLKVLHASDNAFSGPLPAAVGQLTKLEELILNENNLTGQLPSELGQLSLLQVLTLKNNAFGGTLPEQALEKMTNLRTLAIQRLSIKGPGIAGSIPAFRSHRRLTKLQLENQRFDGSLDSEFLLSSPTGETVEADLRGNALTGAIPSTLLNQRFLSLYLAGNRITSVPGPIFDRTTNACAGIRDWMSGDIVSLGCEAFLCPPGKWAPQGRTTSASSSCQVCFDNDDGSYWGRTNCRSSLSIPERERQILVNLYNTVGGRNWKVDDNWLELDRDVCTWHGIGCDPSTGRVTSVTLRNNGLVGMVPSDLFDLPTLQILNLESNQVEIDFNSVTKATNLQSLNLAATGLRFLNTIQNLSALSNLKSLSLASNALNGPIPDGVFRLTSLEDLDLSYNDFTGTLSPRLGGLTNLKRFACDGASLTGQLPGEIGSLLKLEEFLAAENKFTGYLPNGLNSLTNLQTLSLQQKTGNGSGIGGQLLSFTNLEQLTSLHLDSNKLTGTLPANFLINSRRLQMNIDVGLSDNNLQGTVPDGWIRFEKLFVDLSGNKISGIPASLCSKTGWMKGAVEKFRCDAILCPGGTYSPIGYMADVSSSCNSCQSSTSFGTTHCDGKGTTDTSSELNILLQLYSATGGEGWNNKGGWETSSNYCSTFYGLECDGAGRVSALKLANNNLKGSVPQSVFNLQFLRELNLSGNSVDLTFETIGKAEKLINLYLGNTHMDSVNGIGAASNLQILSLADNNLKGTIPDELRRITTLKKLDLGHNFFSGQLKDVIEGMKSLESLHLHHNQLTGRIPAALGDLVNLEELNLAENNFEGTLPIEMNQLTNLRFLSLQREGGILGTSDIGIDQGKSSLSGKGVAGPLPAFDKLTLLTELYLGVNSFTGSIPFNFLGGLINKSAKIRIDLTSNLLTGTIPASMTQFDNLSLYASGNRLTGIADGLCDKSDWLDGDVGSFKCDGILCPIGTYNAIGRKSSNAPLCQTCSTGTSGYLGSFDCLTSDEIQEGSEREVLEKLYYAMDGPNWIDNSNWLDPDESICNWRGIQCDSSSANSVSSIDLSYNRLSNQFPSRTYQLPNLKELNLQGNDITFTFNGIQNAANLESLDLEDTGLTSLFGIGQARTLKLLRVDKNNFGSFPNEVFDLTNLQVLSLSGNVFSQQLMPSSLQFLSSMNYFACSGCGFAGPVPDWLGSIQNLEYLKLSQNAFTGTLPSTLEQITPLKHLDLSDQATLGRGLYGNILSFANQTDLTELYLQHNMFDGPIPDNLLSSVKTGELVTVDLRFNIFSGSVPVQLGNIDQLNLYLASNDIQSIPQSMCGKDWNGGDVAQNGCDGILCPAGTFNSFGRKTAGVNCFACDSPLTATSLGNIFCGSAVEHESLKILYRSYGGPNWKSANNWLVSEDHCSWEGITCWSGGDYDGLVKRIELPDNNMVGEMPFALIWQLEGLAYVDMQKNDISLPWFMIGNAVNLETIKLSYTSINSLMGIEEAKSLKELHLTGTTLTGPIPDELFSLTGLESLFLSNNGFSGSISSEFGKLKELKNLYLLGNKLTGTIPTEFGYLARLQHLSLGKNMLNGSIPRQITSLPLLEFLSLENESGSSGGGLSGPLPALDGLPSIRELYLQHNTFTGSIPAHFLQGVRDKSAVNTVDLGFNNVVGSIPAELSSFDKLNLFLVGNEISGVPKEICTNLGWMDGEVANGCDAILCPPGTFNSDGRQVHLTTPCETCTFPGSARNYGATACGPGSSDALTDGSILFDLYDATGGSSWTNSTGWQSDMVPYCEWHGVACAATNNGELRVSELNLAGNNLNGLIPSKVFYLQGLKKLDISKNPVSITFQDVNQATELNEIYFDETLVRNMNGIGGAKKLETLHASKNSFGGQPIPNEIFDISTLKDVSLSDSMLAGTLSGNIGQLANLERLTLDQNSLSGELPGQLGQLRALKELEISNNEWIGTLPSSWQGMIALEALSLNNHEEKSAGVTGPLLSFATMPNLRELSLSNNLLTGTIPFNFFSGIADKNNLITINLDHNHIAGTVPPQLQSFIKLNIDLAGNLVTGIGEGLCNQSEWNGGDVGKFLCDGILCPGGTYSRTGRQTSTGICETCPGDETSPYLGVTSCATLDKQREKEILTKLFQATNGNSWKNKDGWTDTASDVCSWYGIECEEGSSVESIHLGSNNLVGSVPKEIFELPNLKSLLLYSNRVEFSFDGIGEAKKLEILYLDSTKLRSVAGIGDATSLVEIDVGFNQLSGPIPSEIGNLVNLQSFIGSVNMFSGTIPDLSALRKLSALRLSNNKLSGSLPSFSRLSNIKALDLSENDLVGSIPPNFLESINPEDSISVDISNNMLTGSVPASLSRVQDVTIYLRDNRISGIDPSLCTNDGWNEGDVGSFQCNGILCPAGTYAVSGRASRTGSSCEPCRRNKFYGGSTCGGGSAATSRSQVWSPALFVAVTTSLISLLF